MKTYGRIPIAGAGPKKAGFADPSIAAWPCWSWFGQVAQAGSGRAAESWRSMMLILRCARKQQGGTSFDAGGYR